MRDTSPGGELDRLSLADFYSADPPMQRCLELAHLAARTELPVLILGETGTGKTLLARAIHGASARSDRPFVSFNAAALSETLVDSQLFGHERGAFTGAASAVKGKFELADGGTLFVDEIADLSPSGQSKILRAIEYGEFERLGSEQLRRADVRVVSATHVPLAVLTREGAFRRDLFYRLSGITIRVPALRDRPKDLPVLLAHEIARASRQQAKPIVGLDPAAAERLLAYTWPGNLRELNKTIRAAVALTEGDVIGPEVVLLHEDDEAAAGLEQPGAPLPTRRLPDAPDDDQSLQRAIERHIREVLERAGGSKRRAARMLAISRSTLERKLAQMRADPN